MTRYRVAFDGKWQGTFDDRNDAINWGHAVGDTGRIVHVVQRRWLWTKLIATFPEGEGHVAGVYWSIRGPGGPGT